MCLSKNDYKELKEIVKTGILRKHKKWQTDFAAFVNSPYGENENEFDRSIHITRRARDFYKTAMEMESFYRKSLITAGAESLLIEGFLSLDDLAPLSAELRQEFEEFLARRTSR